MQILCVKSATHTRREGDEQPYEMTYSEGVIYEVTDAEARDLAAFQDHFKAADGEPLVVEEPAPEPKKKAQEKAESKESKDK